jgi:uncharacterized protein (DUF608 family)
MKRRDLLGYLAGAGVGVTQPVTVSANSARWPFNRADLNCWTKIEADGLAGPVPGCVFAGRTLESGVPLGGIGTGYFNLDGSGKIGFYSIYNDRVPPKFFGQDWLTLEVGTRRVPLSSARIEYWGHFPVADLAVAFPEIPVEAGIRAFAPFIPGDAAISNTPAVIFEIEMRNMSAQNLSAKLILRFPPPPDRASLAVRGQDVIADAGDSASYRVVAEIPPQGTRRVRFAVGWYAPSWRDSGNELHVNRYSQRFHDAAEAAEFALSRSSLISKRILAWQAAIYNAALPGWLSDALVQGFYSLAKNTTWIARTRSDEWWGENGWVTHSESHTGCPIVETMVCRIHGHFALLYFFPELEATTLSAFRHFQISDGEIPFCFGIPTSMRDPRFHCQHPLNSGQYAQMIYRLFLRTGDRSQLQFFYESAKRAIRYQYSLDNDGCGLVHEQPHVRPGEAWPANQFYDVWPWAGTSSYVAGTWLATLAAGKGLAQATGDREFTAECDDRLRRAKASFESRLWNGKYYRLWSDPENRQSNEVSLGNQLMGQWCARVLNLPGVLPPDHIESALNEVERLNMNATAYGLINGVSPDGQPYDTKVHPSADFGLNIFVGENLCAAMTFAYQGRAETGLEIARRMYEAMALKQSSPWNQRCLLSGRTGLPMWGDDYYSNLAIWAFPMALEKQGVGEFAKSGLLPAILRAS